MTLLELLATGEPFADNPAALAWALEPVTVWVDVPWLEFLIYLHDQDIDRPTLVSERDTAPTANRRTAAQYFLDAIAAGRDLATSDSRVRTLLTNSGLSGAQKTALQNLAQAQQPRWQANGVTESVGLGSVSNARGGN